MSERTVTPDEVWEWIEQDTLPGLRPSACIDYYRMINKVKADAWDECFETIERDARIDWCVAEVPKNPFKIEEG